MKTLEKKISAPVIILIAVTSVSILLIFNICVRVYVNRQAAAEITNVIQNTKTLYSDLLSSDLIDERGVDADRLSALKTLRTALQVSKFSINTDIFITGVKGSVIYPTDYTDTFFTDPLIQKVRDRAQNDDEIVSFRYLGNRYFAMRLSKTAARGTFSVYFVSSAVFAKRLVRSANLALIVILAASAAVGVAVVVSRARKLSRPIKTVASAAKSIGSGDYVTVGENSDCLELQALIAGVNEMSGKLSRSEKAQKTFLQNASHEIRTPLMSIQGYAEGISKGIFTDAAKTADIIAGEAKRLNALVEELLTLSKLESGNYGRQFETQNLADAVKDHIQKASGYASLNGKTISLRVETENVAVRVDEALLFQAVYNVLTNAVKYARSEVTVTVRASGGRAVLLISDDGDGISATDLPHIFERFYKGKNGSFGLGLAIAKTSLDLMGGTISARNASGAVFEITLPLI